MTCLIFENMCDLRRTSSWVAILVWGALASAIFEGTLSAAEREPAVSPIKPVTAGKGAVVYETDILPLLEARCGQCHGGALRKGGLDVRRRFLLVEGGDSGASIVPGKPDESLLFEKISKKEMPPKEPLDARQIELIRGWIAAGAPTKAAKEEPLEATERADTLSPEDRQHWAFQPPQRPRVPNVKATGRVRTAIDAFILAGLEARGLTLNVDAEPRVLVRRLYFDLIGLPPTAEQVDEFVAARDPLAYEKLVDTLLASPHYGERWGRHWLDIAGYADSDGFLEADRERPEAWRYRDYVIRSLNSDKPYDRFVHEQLAGDELFDWRRASELTPAITDALVATGFLRTASDPTYIGYKELPEIHKVLADVQQIVGSAFLGITVQCARCHDHKLDPMSQRDYYRLQAVFAPAYDPKRWLASGERVIPLATDENRERFEKLNKATNERIAALSNQLVELATKTRAKWLDGQLKSVDASVRETVKQALLVDPAKRTAVHKQVIEQHAKAIVIDDKAVAEAYPEQKAEGDALVAAITAEKGLLKNIPQVRGLLDLDGPVAETVVLRRGDYRHPGKKVEPGVPSVLAEPGFDLKPVAGYKTSGRRKVFAEWLSSPTHPTFARLQVNRIWAGHFGRGLFDTMDDMGRSGKGPSHPELLDWLSREFVEGGFRQKALHRLIVTSSVYRQASTFDREKGAVDAGNAWYWAFRPRRMDGETLRDGLLAVAGKLNRQPFGPPVDVAVQKDGSISTPDTEQGNRRSVYIKVRRSQPLTLLESFDTPRMEINCTRRTEAIVATQALALQNSPFVETTGRALAERVRAHSADRKTRVAWLWQTLYGRLPRASELAHIEEFLGEAARLSTSSQASTPMPAGTVAPVDEANVWTQLILALLNTNEFLFVD